MDNVIIKMKKVLHNLKNFLINTISIGQADEDKVDEKQEFFDQVRKAHKDWQIAVENFNYYIDPDIIDYAVYDINAAEKKFVYLIKKARKENLNADMIN
jgi:hypothetical protein